ncbi:MAG: hypothetical protein COA57_03810 [Flavobacteriales bacterium]|nr:MAG: hypothetical protein COA57_03810 [Flavobacteriales bacterium]
MIKSEFALYRSRYASLSGLFDSQLLQAKDAAKIESHEKNAVTQSNNVLGMFKIYLDYIWTKLKVVNF